FFPGLKGFDVRGWHSFSPIPKALEGAMDQFFVFPRQAAEKKGGVAALLLQERTLNRPFEVVDLLVGDPRLFFQSRPLLREPLADDFFNICADLNQVRRHRFRVDRLSAHSCPSIPGLRVSSPLTD